MTRSGIRPRSGGVLLLLWLLGLAACGGPAEEGRLLEASRGLADELQRTLGARLQAAMAEGGPVRAIAVCSDEAPAIAARLSAQSGAAVSRTALRVRNPTNAPDPEARRILAQLQAQIAAGADQPVEHLAPRPGGGMRYMRAILLQPLCATCHGKALDPAVAAAVAERYPDDAATGFEVGELRGAFLVDWPAEAQPGS